MAGPFRAARIYTIAVRQVVKRRGHKKAQKTQKETVFWPGLAGWLRLKTRGYIPVAARPEFLEVTATVGGEFG